MSVLNTTGPNAATSGSAECKLRGECILTEPLVSPEWYLPLVPRAEGSNPTPFVAGCTSAIR